MTRQLSVLLAAGIPLEETLATSAFLFYRFAQTQAGKLTLDSLVLKLPILARLSKGLNAARFASTLAILVRSGVPLIEALHIGAAVTTNLIFNELLSLLLIESPKALVYPVSLSAPLIFRQ